MNFTKDELSSLKVFTESYLRDIRELLNHPELETFLNKEIEKTTQLLNKIDVNLKE